MTGAGTAQLVEHPPEKSGAKLMQVRIFGAARDFSLSIHFQCRLLQCLYSPRVQSHASASVRTLKFQTLAAIPFFGHTKIPHTLTGMGSAALAAAVLYPGKATRISHKGQRSTKRRRMMIMFPR